MTAYSITKEFPDRGGNGQATDLQDLDNFMVAAAASMEFPNDGDVIVLLRSTAVGTVTATLVAQPDPYGRGGATVGDVILTIPIGSTTPQMAMFPQINPAMFNNLGIAQITLNSATNVTVAFVRLKKVR